MRSVPLRGCGPESTIRVMAPEADRLPTGPHRWQDFLALDEDDLRELVDGHFLEIEVPNEFHEWVVTWLVTSLTNWAHPRGAGFAFASGYKVRIRVDRGVMPDVQFYRGRRGRLPLRGLHRGAPDLAVEVVSPSSRRWDRVVKLAWYASIGTPEYWIVDPATRTLDRFLLSPAGTLELAGHHAGDESFAPETFPGLVIDLAQLWPVADD
jgi:Uma2 family endonuclease